MLYGLGSAICVDTEETLWRKLKLPTTKGYIVTKFNQDTFKQQLFALLETYHNLNELNLTKWERLRVHHILNELFEAVKKSRKDM